MAAKSPSTRAEPLPPRRVLVVDDDSSQRRLHARTLEDAGFEVHTADNGTRAVELLAQTDFHAIVSDITMPEMGGLALLRTVRERDLDVPVVLITGSPNVETAAEAVQYGAYQYLLKPVELGRLQQVVGGAAELGRSAQAKKEAMSAFESGKFLAHRTDLEATFARAIVSLWIAYQPIVHSATRSLYGYEALLRTSERTLPHPGAVLDAAETLGKLEELGRTVRSKATAPFLDRDPGIALFVNLHARDLDDKTLTWESTPLAKIATQVVLEITERAALADVRDFASKVALLREMGFRIAIDDLGAGYAGLTSLAMLEPEFVKLDMSLIRDVHLSRTKQKLIRGMTSLCKDMGMVVVAEGVETSDERDVLIEMGCDLLQGYLFARPGQPFPDFQW